MEGACGDLGHGFDVGWVVWRRYHAPRKVVEVGVFEVRLRERGHIYRGVITQRGKHSKGKKEKEGNKEERRALKLNKPEN